MNTYRTLLIFFLFFPCPISGLSAQSHEGTALTFGYNTGYGNWENFNTVLHEYRSQYTYFTDNGDLSDPKKGFTFGFNIVGENKQFMDACMGGMKASAWSCGFAPTGSDVCETYLIKSEFINLSAGWYLFNRPFMRIGAAAGLSLNFVHVKSSSASAVNEKAKEEKYLVMIGGSEVTQLDKGFFTGAVFNVPVAFGNKFAFGITPYYTLPFWKVNASEMRDTMMPNSVPQQEVSAYKGWMAYGGLRFTLSLGGFSI